jgi:hypothetical protein
MRDRSLLRLAVLFFALFVAVLAVFFSVNG